MKKTPAIQRTLSAGAAVCLIAVALSGCELLVDFDRSKIPMEAGGVGNDATVTDSATPTEAGDDGTVSGEVGPEAAGDDAGDGSVDADTGPGNDDGGGDAADVTAVDASLGDTGLDAGLVDAGADALDTAVDTADAPSADAAGGDDSG